MVRTRAPFKLFTADHFVSSETRMVVTEADPTTRIVTEINAEPAGREYARLVGLAVDKLTPMIFATHPVVVKVGGRYYTRSIQKVNDDESLTFFCAIDKGVVLTVARAPISCTTSTRCSMSSGSRSARRNSSSAVSASCARWSWRRSSRRSRQGGFSPQTTSSASARSASSSRRCT